MESRKHADGGGGTVVGVGGRAGRRDALSEMEVSRALERLTVAHAMSYHGCVLSPVAERPLSHRSSGAGGDIEKPKAKKKKTFIPVSRKGIYSARGPTTVERCCASRVGAPEHAQPLFNLSTFWGGV